MKRKDYQLPTMEIVEIQQQAQLPADSGSGEVNATMDNEWEEEDI